MMKEISREEIENYNNIMGSKTISAASAEETIKRVNDLALEIKEAYSLEKAWKLDWLTSKLDEGSHTIEFFPPEIQIQPNGDVLVSPFIVNLDGGDEFGPSFEMEACMSPKTLEAFGIVNGYQIVEQYNKEWDQVDSCAQGAINEATTEKLFDAFRAFKAASADRFMGWRHYGLSLTIEIVRKKNIDKVSISGHECYVSDISSELKKLKRSIHRKTSR